MLKSLFRKKPTVRDRSYLQAISRGWPDRTGFYRWKNRGNHRIFSISTPHMVSGKSYEFMTLDDEGIMTAEKAAHAMCRTANLGIKFTETNRVPVSVQIKIKIEDNFTEKIKRTIASFMDFENIEDERIQA